MTRPWFLALATPLGLVGAPGPAELEACRELAATVAVNL